MFTLNMFERVSDRSLRLVTTRGGEGGRSAEHLGQILACPKRYAV